MQPSDVHSIMSPGCMIMIYHPLKQTDRLTSVLNEGRVFTNMLANPHSTSILQISHDGMTAFKTNHPLYTLTLIPKD